MDVTYSAWDRQENEPTRWYSLFIKHYLGIGQGRTIARAYLSFAKDLGPEAYQRALIRRGAPLQWYTAANVWRWEERAGAYEMHTSELAMAAVAEANKKLRLLAVDAVEALALSLTSERFRVLAAKEILDRAGLPAVSRQEVTNRVTLSADEMAEAKKELEAWQEKHESG